MATATRKSYGTRTQLWPRGDTCEHREDVNGPNLRVKNDKGRWVKPSAELRRRLKIELLAEGYADRDILCCDSYLLDELLKKGGDGWEYFEDVRNLHADPSDWDIDQCREYCEGNGIDKPDDEEDEDDWRDVCRDFAQENPAEVYEWWRVTSWLCGQLHKCGYVTIDNDFGCWWGRCCTGQQYIMDGTLQEVAAQFVK